MTEPEMLIPLEDQIDAYVLGHMDDRDARQFATRLAVDPALRARVDALSDHFLALDGTAEPLAVTDDMWSGIEARLDGTPNEATDTVGAAATPAVAGAAGWRSWVAAASVVVALGAGFLGGMAVGPGTQPPVVIAILADDALAPGAIVEAYGNDSVRIVPLEQFTAESDRVFEVWTLPASSDGPVSLGTFQTAADITLSGPNLPDPQSGQLYEITLEPAGGSPIGRPTGPILYKGLAQVPVI